MFDGPISVIQPAISNLKERERLQTFTSSLHSVSLISENSSFMEETEWAGKVEQFLTHLIYSLFFILHVGNLIFGTSIIFPLFFDLKLHLGKVIDDFVQLCSPSLFWFTFISIIIEYLMIIVFASSTFMMTCNTSEETVSYKLD